MVNRNSHLLALPESDRIEQLLGDLMPTAPSQPATTNNGAQGTGAQGACAVGQFLAAVNWQNDANFMTSMHPASILEKEANMNGSTSAAVIGALSVQKFLAAVNWPNRADAARLSFQDENAVSRARMVVDAFMDEVAWD